VTGWPGRRPAGGVQCLTRLRAGDPGRVRRLAEIPRPGALPRGMSQYSSLVTR
jgi:hypothetical protein